MSNERGFELVSAAADGRLEEEQQAELEALLAESSAVRRFQAELGRLETLLSAVPEPTFPPALHGRIMDRLPRRAVPVARPAGFGLPMLGNAMRYGLAAAVGGILTVGVYETTSLTQESVNYEELVGTVARDGRPPGVELVDHHQVRAEGLTGSVHLRRSADVLLLDLQIESTGPIDIFVDFPHAMLLPAALMQDGQPIETVEIADRFLRTRSNGRRHLVLSFRRATETDIQGHLKIGIEFSRNGVVLQRNSLSPAS